MGNILLGHFIKHKLHISEQYSQGGRNIVAIFVKRVQIGFDFQEEIFLTTQFVNVSTYLLTIYVHPVPANIPKQIVPIPTYCIVYGSLNYFFKHYLPKVSKKHYIHTWFERKLNIKFQQPTGDFISALCTFVVPWDVKDNKVREFFCNIIPLEPGNFTLFFYVLTF